MSNDLPGMPGEPAPGVRTTPDHEELLVGDLVTVAVLRPSETHGRATTFLAKTADLDEIDAIVVGWKVPPSTRLADTMEVVVVYQASNIRMRVVKTLVSRKDAPNLVRNLLRQFEL